MTSHHPFRGALVVLLLAALAASAVPAPAALAQTNLPGSLYTIDGYVYDGYAKPLSGAQVQANPASGNPLNAKTDASGHYSIPSLAAGTYNLTASAAGLDASFVPVKVQGADTTIQQSFLLKAPNQVVYGQPLTLKGIVRAESDKKPVPDVIIEIYNYYAPSGGYAGGMPVRNDQQTTVRSGADGSYSVVLSEGSVNINARKDGFDILHAYFEMRSDRTLDLPMRAASTNSVTIEGTIKSSEGSVLPNAWVSVQPDYQKQCNDRGCSTSAQPGVAEPASSGGDANFYYEPAVSPYASATADGQGHYSLQTTPGDLLVSANAPDHIQGQRAVSASSGSRQTVDLVLEKIPADAVHISGKALDRDTGKPIPAAQVSIENQKWGQWNSTMARDDGSFDIWAKPGYTLVTVAAYKDYYTPCASDGAYAKPGSDIRAPEPACQSQQRDREYMPAIQVVNQDSGPAELTFRLPARAIPDATFQGYVVNATSKQGVPHATVAFYNELTRDYGQAVTDENGSYKILVNAGYYTIRAYADHYYDAAVNADIKSGQTQRLDLFAQPGEKRYGGVMYYGVADKAMAPHEGVAASGSSGGAPAPMTTSAGQDASATQGREAYFGSGGGLGPYAPASQGVVGGKSPGATAPLAMVSVLAVLGFVAARRFPKKP